jgi:hypothetical protein
VLELTIITNLTDLSPIRNEILWKKIAQIGNYCQLRQPAARYKGLSHITNVL